MTQAIAAYGTTLSWNGETLAEITNISGPGISFDTIDATHYTSTDHFKEFIAGFGDGGEVTIEGNFIPGDTDGQVAFITDAFAKTVREVIVTLSPSATTLTWTFDALVTKLDFAQPMDNKLGFTATLKVSGVPALGITAATGPSGLVVTGNVSGALTLTPTYAAGTYEYATDGSSDASVTVTVTAAGADTITVNGSAVTSGVPSSSISLTSGAITTITVVVGETGKVSKTYTIRIVGGS